MAIPPFNSAASLGQQKPAGKGKGKANGKGKVGNPSTFRVIPVTPPEDLRRIGIGKGKFDMLGKGKGKGKEPESQEPDTDAEGQEEICPWNASQFHDCATSNLIFDGLR